MERLSRNMIYDGFHKSRKASILLCVILFLDICSTVYGLMVCDGNSSASTNVALNKSSSQSSTFMSTGYPQPNGDAYRANDGNTNPDFNAGSCSHTLKDVDPIAWWMVDFGGTFMIAAVHIKNRDRFPERLRNLHIAVADTTTIGTDGLLADGRLCFYYTANNSTSSETLIFPCKPFTYGRYLRISIYPNDWLKPLAMCEVMAWGYQVNCSEVPDITSSFSVYSTTAVYEDVSTSALSDVFTTSTVYESDSTSTVSDVFTTSSIEVTSTGMFGISSMSPSQTSDFQITSSDTPSITSYILSSSVLPSSSSSSSSSTTTTTRSPPSSCACMCENKQNAVSVNISLEEQIEILKKELTIDKKETSSFKRKLVSAEDDRISAKSIGFIGVVVLSLVFGGIFILDAPLLYDSVKNLINFARNIKG